MRQTTVVSIFHLKKLKVPQNFLLPINHFAQHLGAAHLTKEVVSSFGQGIFSLF